MNKNFYELDSMPVHSDEFPPISEQSILLVETIKGFKNFLHQDYAAVMDTLNRDNFSILDNKKDLQEFYNTKDSSVLSEHLSNDTEITGDHFTFTSEQNKADFCKLKINNIYENSGVDALIKNADALQFEVTLKDNEKQLLSSLIIHSADVQCSRCMDTLMTPDEFFSSRNIDKAYQVGQEALDAINSSIDSYMEFSPERMKNVARPILGENDEVLTDLNDIKNSSPKEDPDADRYISI